MNEKNDFALVRKPSRAVEKTTPRTKRLLSDMVADTLALARDGKSFAEELQRAAEAGDSEAQFKLGQIHYDRRSHVKDRHGNYVTKRNLDPELRLAFQWFHRAADQGHAQAQYEVFRMLF